MTDVRRQLPPFLYLPCTMRRDGGTFDPVLLPVPAGNGLVAYTALDRLRRGESEEQDWAVVPITMIRELRESLGFEAILLDHGLPEEERAHG
jgi:hypothetical protein